MSSVSSVNPILASSRGTISHSLWPLLLTLLVSTTILIHANPIPFNAVKYASNSDTIEDAANSKRKETTFPQSNDAVLTANSTSSYAYVSTASSTSSKGHVSEGKSITDNELVLPTGSSSSSSSSSRGDGKKITENEFVVQYLQQFHYIEPGAMTSEDGAVKKLKKFQEMANIEQTGIVDNDTITMMKRPRCGDPDLDDPRLINEMMGAHEATDCEIHGGNCDDDRSKRYALYGTKWPQKQISYCIVNYPVNATTKTKKVYAQEISQAIKKWTIFIPIKILKLECEDKPEIRIKFVKGMHGDRFVFDGAGGVLAHAFFPSRRPRKPHPLTGDVHLDNEEHWVNKGRGDGTCFPYVFTHELGHSLGLTHSKNKNSLMWPFYIPCYEEIKLQRDDINGIQAIYGKPDIQAVGQTTMLHESPQLIESTREAQKYCQENGQILCSKKDLQRVVASDRDLHHTEWFWIRDGAPTMAKVDEAECQLKKDDAAAIGCYYDKLLITTNVEPKVKALCCPLKGALAEIDEPDVRLCDGVFDAMIRFRAERIFDTGEEGIPTTRLHSVVFKDDQVYAFDVFGPAKGFPTKIKDAFPGFQENYVCSAIVLPFSSGSTRLILFGFKNYYVYQVKEKFELLQGYPMAISMWGLQGLDSCPRVVFILADTIHFVQGTRLWIYNDGSEVVIPRDLADDKEQLTTSRVGLASSEFSWASISSASSWKSNKIFFFNNKGTYHYFDGVANQFVNGYPRNTAHQWFHFCP